MSAYVFDLRPDLLEELCWQEYASGAIVDRASGEEDSVVARDMARVLAIEFHEPTRTVPRYEWYVIFGGIPVGAMTPVVFLADGVRQIALPKAGLFSYIVERMHVMLGARRESYPVILPAPLSVPADRRMLSSHALLFRVSSAKAYLVPTKYAFDYLLKHNRITTKENDEDVEF